MSEMTFDEQRLAEAIDTANTDFYIHDLVVHIGPTVKEKGYFTVTLTSMFDYVPSTFKTLCAVGDFFGTDKVNVDHDSMECESGGCDTCGHGSRYVFTLHVFPVA